MNTIQDDNGPLTTPLPEPGKTRKAPAPPRESRFFGSSTDMFASAVLVAVVLVYLFTFETIVELAVEYLGEWVLYLLGGIGVLLYVRDAAIKISSWIETDQDRMEQMTVLEKLRVNEAREEREAKRVERG